MPGKVHLESVRLFAAADKLATTESLGPAKFRAAVGVWLNECATTTKRIEGGSGQTTVVTLPCVRGILDVIERAE